jgi:predicted ATPase
MPVSSVNVAGFRRLKDAGAELEPLNVLVGGNNSGKSSLLQALHFANVVCQKAQFGPPSGGVVSGSLAESHLDRCPAATIEAISYGQVLLRGGTLVIDLGDEQGQTTTVSVTGGPARSLSVQAGPGPFLDGLRDPHSPFAIYVPGLAGVPASEPLRPPDGVAAAVARGDAGSVLRDVLYGLRGNQHDWDVFGALLRDIFPEVTLNVELNEKDNTVRVLAEVGGMHVPLEACGAGVLQAVQILSYATYYCPRLLLLDEPDAHLHPHNQRVIADLVSRLADEQPELRVIIATHSRHLLDALRHGARVIWMRDGTPQKPGEAGFVSMLLELGALDEGDKLRDGRYDCLFLTEDRRPRVLKTLLEANGFDLSRTLVWPYGSSTQLEAAKAVARFVREYAKGTRVAVHRDRDYLTDEEVEGELQGFKDARIPCFITDGVDVESHLLDADYLAARNPQRDLAWWQNALDTVTEETKGTSIAKFVAGRRASKRRAGQDATDDNALYAECQADCERDPVRYRHGKSVLKALRTRCQRETRQNLHEDADSHLENEQLQKVAAIIWRKGQRA